MHHLGHTRRQQPCKMFSLRLPMRPPAGNPPSGTPLPVGELALFLQQRVPGYEGNNETAREVRGEEGGV